MLNRRQVGEEMFLQHLDEIEDIVRRVAIRRRCNDDEAQELYSEVMLHLIEDDYAVLRRFRGTSTWSTYLTVVIQRLLLDLRAKAWGRWRPSAVARRLGAVAVELERRIERDGLEPSTVVRQMVTEGLAKGVAELERLAAQLPKRRTARGESTEISWESVQDPAHGEEWADAVERRRRAAQLDASLGSALGGLSPHERMLLDLRFGRGWTVRRIAASRREKERPLYRRFEGILRRLRRCLVASGLSWHDIADSLEGDVDLDFDLGR